MLVGSLLDVWEAVFDLPHPRWGDSKYAGCLCGGDEFGKLVTLQELCHLLRYRSDGGVVECHFSHGGGVF